MAIARPLDAARRDDDELIASINVTPLVDIVLVLLVVLMVAAAFVVSQAIPLELPSTGGSAGEAPVVTVSIDPDGQLYVDGEPTTIEELRADASARARADRGTRAVIAAHSEARHGHVVTVVDALRTAGIHHYAVVVPPAEP